MDKMIPISQPSISDLEKSYVNDALDSGWVSSIGKYVDLFEKKFAEFCDTRYAICVANGTVALHLALVAMGIKKGDEVIVPDFTFVATSNAVVYTGATPVFCDINENTLCMDETKLEALINDKTKAIIPVHIYGHPANMEKINKIAKKYKIFVLEDAAEAHGAKIDGKRVGSMGDCGIFSFYGNKIFTTGEGGMITTNNIELQKRIRSLRDHAMSNTKRYWHEEIGFNYRMTNIQAAIGLAQIERAEELLNKKRKIFEQYKENLKGIEGIKLNFDSEVNIENVFWMICLEVDSFSEKTRKEFMIYLKENGVDSRPFFFPISDMPMYHVANTPITHKIYQKGINLPTFYDLTMEDIDYVCDIIKAGLKRMGQ